MGGEGAVIFTYGTLKRGWFSNHGLMQEMIRSGDASFLGTAHTCDPLPLVCGPYHVPFLLNFPGAGQHVRGELYSAAPREIARMDELEGTCRGHYERLPIRIKIFKEFEDGGSGEEMEVETYYAYRSYAGELWRRSGERGFEVYWEKEATGYVKRKDRPQDITFLDQIRISVASN